MTDQGFTWDITGQVEGYTIRERFDVDTWNNGNIAISKNGKRYYHDFRPTRQERQTKTAQQIAQDILADFYTTATIGAKGYTWYKDQFGRNYSTEAERKQAFRDYTRAYNGLLRLDPSSAADAMATAGGVLLNH